jgi:insertion element IS1 protein InsB
MQYYQHWEQQLDSNLFVTLPSTHINLRTRIKRLMRRTICFSKTEQMHDLVIGLFINRYEFGQAL